MRQLLPIQNDEPDLLAIYGDPPGGAGRVGVRVNMIESLDGGSSAGGKSGALGGRADKRLFQVLRSLADVVLVGAGTIRAEHYGPARFPDDLDRARQERGQGPLPIAVVTRSCELDWSTPFFTDAVARPLVVTVETAPPERRRSAEAVADVVLAGDDRVDLREAMAAFADRSLWHVLAEGGPSLNGDLTAAGLLDELCVTVSPKLLGGDAARIVRGPGLDPPTNLELVSLCEEDGFLFVRARLGR